MLLTRNIWKGVEDEGGVERWADEEEWKKEKKRRKIDEEEEDEEICEAKIKVQSGLDGDQTDDHCRKGSRPGKEKKQRIELRDSDADTDSFLFWIVKGWRKCLKIVRYRDERNNNITV